MKQGTAKIAVLAALLLALAPSLSAQAGAALPDYLRIELCRLEETWSVLDRFAQQIWPGWTGYADVPFRFSYPNGVQMLVGHPSPTDGFELVPGVEVRGQRVYLDRRNEIPLALKPPLSGGGGIIPFGKDTRVFIVDMKMSVDEEPEAGQAPARKPEDRPRYRSESQILINIHELFHCYQRSVYQYRFGNLRFNTDSKYATYAEVEGLALENAYLDPDDRNSRIDLKDFLAARLTKRGSMTEAERNRESEDDLMEGTAVYAETRALELIRKGYTPLIGPEDDPDFDAFRTVGALLKDKLEMLRTSRVNTMDSRGKCYPYGCFQALLLTRHFPGWQERFFQDKKFLDQVLAESLGLEPAALEAVAATLRDRYPLGEIAGRHGQLIRERDSALAMIQKRKGRVYVVNFKPTDEYLSPRGRGPSYLLGLVSIFPDGIERVRVQDVLFEGEKSPMIQDQLYYLKWVDTKARAGTRGYVLTFGRREGDDVFYDAEFRTRGFRLRAPKIQVQVTRNLIKVNVLAKLKVSGP